MDVNMMIELNDCPVCGGIGCLEEEGGCRYYVQCLDCGSHSVDVDFKSEAERLIAAQKTAMLWNAGKAISSHPGE